MGRPESLRSICLLPTPTFRISRPLGWLAGDLLPICRRFRQQKGPARWFFPQTETIWPFSASSNAKFQWTKWRGRSANLSADRIGRSLQPPANRMNRILTSFSHSIRRAKAEKISGKRRLIGGNGGKRGRASNSERKSIRKWIDFWQGGAKSAETSRERSIWQPCHVKWALYPASTWRNKSF